MTSPVMRDAITSEPGFDGRAPALDFKPDDFGDTSAEVDGGTYETMRGCAGGECHFGAYWIGDDYALDELGIFDDRDAAEAACARHRSAQVAA